MWGCAPPKSVPHAAMSAGAHFAQGGLASRSGDMPFGY